MQTNLYIPGRLKNGSSGANSENGIAKDVDNLRPISLLPVTGKIFWEKIINARLTDHMEMNGLYFDRQGGFRKNQ